MTTKKVKKKVEAQSVVAPPSRVDSAEDADASAVADSRAVFPIVGIGASAGGLAAFEAFFSGMPVDKDPGMAFVLVQHLAPDHKSILTELIQRYTRMQAFEVEDGMQVHPNCAYIIPPGRDMAFLNGTLQLLEPSAPRGQRLPIDFFFRSLAQDQGERAIGIVLSGTGSDGTQGVRAIKGEGGLVMVQNPESTEFDGMPRSAIATGLVDYELPPAEMPARLIAYITHALSHLQRDPAHTLKVDGALKRIFVLLRAQTGHDFSQYKPSTVNRRIERRMAVHQIGAIDNYVRFMQQSPPEVEALFRDLLIGVTNFFRDPEPFQVLEEQIIPKLFDDKPADSVIRVWSAGCSTGEEAYSIAILLQERVKALKKSYAVQLFATDIDKRAIATARAGLYPASIAADMTPERLARFFSTESDAGTYSVHKGIRNMVVFSEHNLIKDPPFSKLDLISCRNLMIYLGAELQKKLIPLFHYALKPGGFLLLGTSEGVSEFAELFAVVDRKSKLYQRREDLRRIQRGGHRPALPPLMVMDSVHPRGAIRPALPLKQSMREVAEKALLLQLAPASALVTEQGDILYLHGRTGMYLEPAPGEAGISNILKMAREGLRRDLGSTLRKAAASKDVVRCPGLRVKTNGHFTRVNLTICPVASAAATLESSRSESYIYLVIMEDAPATTAEAVQQIDLPSADASTASNADADADADARIAALKRELRAKEEYLQSAHEELESSNEELKSSNEEMQSVNEELQSTNEELETSKEELQSVNEELGTVNTELQSKVVDLSRINNDMNNLLAGTGIGTVFVDFQMRILRFTPTASAIINLIQSDVGRPVNHIVSNLVGYSSLVADLQHVFDTLTPKEVNVQATDDNWYSLRIRPYRTLDNVIEGAVITFVDITDAVNTREALRKANEMQRLAVVVQDAHDAITAQDLDGRTLAWNQGAERMYGWSEAEALLMNVRDRIPPELREKALADLRHLSQAEILQPYRTQRLTKQGTVKAISIISTALLNEAGEIYAIATTERAIGETTR